MEPGEVGETPMGPRQRIQKFTNMLASLSSEKTSGCCEGGGEVKGEDECEGGGEELKNHF